MIILPASQSTQNNNVAFNNQCLGIVLAGGLSSRMGQDKASLLRNETNMLAFSKHLLTQSGIKNVVISGEPACATAQDILVKDNYKEAGPIAGIASVIEKYGPSAVMILPVDLPLITPAAIQKLMHIGELSQKACFYNEHYLPLYLPVNAHTENFLKTAFIEFSNDKINSQSSQVKAKNGPSMRALLKQVPHQAITIETPSSLLNTNTPEEWATAQTKFSQQKT